MSVLLTTPPERFAPIHELPSDRELEILRYVAEGFRNAEIARSLWLSTETVKSHVKHTMRKLGANSRSHAVAIAFRHGLLQ